MGDRLEPLLDLWEDTIRDYHTRVMMTREAREKRRAFNMGQLDRNWGRANTI